MAYIDKNLLPGEELLFHTKKHVIIFLFPLVLIIVSIYAYQLMMTNIFLVKVAWVPAVIALIYLCSVSLEYLTSQFIVTNKRVIMREGFFNRHATELRINTISQVNLDQTLMGQLFNYATVSINSFGTSDAYTIIAHPQLFRKYIEEQLNKLT